MKKTIISLVVILMCFFLSPNIYGQVDIDVNESTGCSFSIKIYWDDMASSCQVSSSILISGSSSSTYLCPYLSGGASGVEVICNNCGDIATIGDCASVSCFSPCSWVCCYTHTCGCGSPVNYRFTPYAGFSNAILDIF